MAHFAELDENNIVLRVVVIADADTATPTGIEDEQIGIDFCKKLFGQDTRWIQTSYNGTMRTRFAGVGYIYDRQRDAFIPPQPFASWVFNKDILNWKPPVAMPDDGKHYKWNEETTSWVEMVQDEA
jgi:hypothetical protein